jgi:hypothetical protein
MKISSLQKLEEKGGDNSHTRARGRTNAREREKMNMCSVVVKHVLIHGGFQINGI